MTTTKVQATVSPLRVYILDSNGIGTSTHVLLIEDGEQTFEVPEGGEVRVRMVDEDDPAVRRRRHGTVAPTEATE